MCKTTRESTRYRYARISACAYRLSYQRKLQNFFFAFCAFAFWFCATTATADDRRRRTESYFYTSDRVRRVARREGNFDLLSAAARSALISLGVYGCPGTVCLCRRRAGPGSSPAEPPQCTDISRVAPQSRTARSRSVPGDRVPYLPRSTFAGSRCTSVLHGAWLTLQLP